MIKIRERNVVVDTLTRKILRKKGHCFLENYRSIRRKSPRNAIPYLNAQLFLELEDRTSKETKPFKNERYFKDVSEAFNKLEKNERLLIYDKYFQFERKDNIRICGEHNISESTFYRKITTSILHFLEAYREGELLDKNHFNIKK